MKSLKFQRFHFKTIFTHNLAARDYAFFYRSGALRGAPGFYFWCGLGKKILLYAWLSIFSQLRQGVKRRKQGGRMAAKHKAAAAGARHKELPRAHGRAHKGAVALTGIVRAQPPFFHGQPMKWDGILLRLFCSKKSCTHKACRIW